MRGLLPLVLAAALASVGLAGCLGPAEPLRNALAGALPGVVAPPDGPRFGRPVTVDAGMGATEPSLVVDPAGRIFVAAPTGLNPLGDPLGHKLSGQLWRSTDGGASFAHLPGLGALGLYGPSVGGGDSDLASDAQGNLYHVDLWLGDVSFMASRDHGATWAQGSPLTFAAAGTDRQWVDVNQATGEVLLAVNSLGTGLWVAKSQDGGLTFPQQSLATPHDARGNCICPPGVLVVDEVTGNVYLPYYMHPSGVGLAVSTDGGATFANLRLPHTDLAALPDEDAGEVGGAFVALDHDTHGNLYLAWEAATERGRRVVLQTSLDHGASWSEPMVLADLPEGAQVFPWVAAGDPGRAAVAWYEATGPAGEERWDVRLAFSADALAARPQVSLARLNEGPVLLGPYERGVLGDFFELAVGPDGRLHAVWNEAGEDGSPRIVHAAQVDGPRLRTGAPAPAPAPMQPLGVAVPKARPAPPEALVHEAAAELGAPPPLGP